MPPKCKFTKEDIVSAALDIARADGIDAVTARAVGAKLNSSSKVIFSLFSNMEELQNELMKEAERGYRSFIENEMKSDKYPPYKASGMGYIRFASEEKQLFRLLFMRDRSNEIIGEKREEIRDIIEVIEKTVGLTEDDAYIFHLEMWIYVHGIATMIATSYLEWDWNIISRMMTDGYEGIKSRFINKEKNKCMQ